MLFCGAKLQKKIEIRKKMRAKNNFFIFFVQNAKMSGGVIRGCTKVKNTFNIGQTYVQHTLSLPNSFAGKDKQKRQPQKPSLLSIECSL